MTPIEYFKLQAKNLYKDYKTKKPYIDEVDGNTYYEYEPKYFAIDEIIYDYNVDENDFNLMKAQHIIALMSGFDKWAELLKASEQELNQARNYLEKHDKNSYNSTGFVSTDLIDGRDRVFYQHNDGESDIEYHEELHGKERQNGIDECRKVGCGFEPNVVVECLHCGKQFPFGEVKVRKLKEEYINDPDDLTENLKEIICKYYPECNGNLLDLLPADALEGVE